MRIESGSIDAKAKHTFIHYRGLHQNLKLAKEPQGRIESFMVHSAHSALLKRYFDWVALFRRLLTLYCCGYSCHYGLPLNGHTYTRFHDTSMNLDHLGNLGLCFFFLHSPFPSSFWNKRFLTITLKPGWPSESNKPIMKWTFVVSKLCGVAVVEYPCKHR